MINYGLPTEITIDGKAYPITNNGDYRLVLDVIAALTDTELPEHKRAGVALNLFYNFDLPDNIEAAYAEMTKFINAGEKEKNAPKKKPLMSWEHDFPVIVPAINKALGCEVRAVSYLHWWTFLSGYMEIGEGSVFSTIVNIRRKLRDSVKLEKHERAFLNANRDLVNIPVALTDDDKDFLAGENE